MISQSAMPQLIVRNLEAAVVRRLRQRAAADGVSVEEAHRRVLRESLLGTASPPERNFLEFLKSMPEVELPPRQQDPPRPINF
jgi:plasmid stability protein